MAALYACTKCHQRFPFEALSQGQQLCKVRGPGRRPGTGTPEGRAGARCLQGRLSRRGPLLRAWQARLAEEPRPSRWGLAGLVGESLTRSRPPWRRVRLLSNRGVFSDPGRAGGGVDSGSPAWPQPSALEILLGRAGCPAAAAGVCRLAAGCGTPCPAGDLPPELGAA